MFLRCWGNVSLSTCLFFIFRFYVHVIPRGLYIYIYIFIYGFWSGFIWYLCIWKDTNKYVCVVQLLTCHKCLFPKWSKNSQAFARGMHFGNNWYLAIIGPRPVTVCCMLPRMSCLLTCHNDAIDAVQNNRLFAPGTDMYPVLRLSHIQKGTYYVQICDNLCDVTLTDIFQYQSKSVDTENISWWDQR
jgi:hypothetical protein